MWWLTLGAAAGIAAFLLWPLPGSARWDIAPDPALAQGKRTYLAGLEDRAPGTGPNVLLIVADDLGRHDVGYAGGVPTPNIDALAATATTFTSAYATAAICAPSRAALLTGRIQNRFGFESQPMQRYVRNRGEYLAFRYLIDTDAMQPFLLDAYPDASQRAAQGLPASEVTLADVFGALGYRTGIFGKWHLGYDTRNHPLRFGFDTQYGFLEAFSLYAPKDATDIETQRQNLFWEEHIWQMGRSGPSAITRNGQAIDEPRYLTDAITAEATDFIDTALDAGRPFFAYLPYSAPHTPFQARREDYDATPPSADHNHRVYAAMIRRLDHDIGELLAHLRARKALDDTLVVFTSDNGGADYTGATDNGPLRGGKFTQFEGGLAVPLVIRWPGAGRRATVHDPVLLSDLFATLLAAVGAPLPEDRPYDSRDLSASATAGPRLLAWRSDFNLAVRRGHWKLLQNVRDHTVALFDLDADPGETRDLSGTRPEVVASLRAALDTWQAPLAPPAWPRVMNYRYEDDGGRYWFAI